MEQQGSTVKAIITGLIVTVVGGVIVAIVVQEGRFDPRRWAEVVTVSSAPTSAPILPLEAGMYVMVTGSGLDMLSFRTGPGLNYPRLAKPGAEDEPFLLADGTVLKVLEGPEVVDNVRWWRLQTTDSTGAIGWAMEGFLLPVTPPGQ